jgi:hypothetical protein
MPADSKASKGKLENPASHFKKPGEVVQDDKLSHQEKKAALDTWEQDARQLVTADNEGMAADKEGSKEADPKLAEVVRAKEEIGEKPKHKQSH